MSFITSASGSTDFVSSAGADLFVSISFMTSASGSTNLLSSAAGGGAPFAPPLSSAITSPMGSTTVELNALPGVAVDGTDGSSTLFVTSGAPGTASGPMKVGGA